MQFNNTKYLKACLEGKESLRGIGLRELVEILVVLTVWFEGIEEGDFKAFKKAQFWSLQNGGIRDGIHAKHRRKEV